MYSRRENPDEPVYRPPSPQEKSEKGRGGGSVHRLTLKDKTKITFLKVFILQIRDSVRTDPSLPSGKIGEGGEGGLYTG